MGDRLSFHTCVGVVWNGVEVWAIRDPHHTPIIRGGGVVGVARGGLPLVWVWEPSR